METSIYYCIQFLIKGLSQSPLYYALFGFDKQMSLSYNYDKKGNPLLTSKRPKKIESLLERIRNCISSGKYRDTFHAIERKAERNITLPEIIHVLTTGRHEKSKDHFDEAFNAWNYAVRGQTVDGLDLRVIVSFDEERDLLIVTAFYLEGRH